MLEGKLENGFEYRIDDDILNDFELMELLIKCRDDASYAVDAGKFMLGSKFKELKESCRVNGRVKSNLVLESIKEILSNKEIKNSQPSAK